MKYETMMMAFRISFNGAIAAVGEEAAENISGSKAIQIINFLNEQDKYWTQKTSKMREPIPNMGPQRTPRLIDYTEDVIKKGVWPEAFVAFILKAAQYSSLLTLYVEDGPFMLSTSFSIRVFSMFKKSPYLLKFTRSNLSERHYEHMLKILYSKNNTVKHTMFRLEKREPLSRYEY